MVPSRALSASGSNRASDGGALESNGIIVGNKNEFKEYTEWCKNCLDESDFIMVGGGKFVVKKSGWRKLGAAQGVSCVSPVGRFTFCNTCFRYEIRKNDIIYDDRCCSIDIAPFGVGLPLDFLVHCLSAGATSRARISR